MTPSGPLAGAIETVIAEMIATGATPHELAEAQAWMANDGPMPNAGKPLAQRRVRQFVDILSELEVAEEDDGAT